MYPFIGSSLDMNFFRKSSLIPTRVFSRNKASSIETQYDLPEREKLIKMGPSSLVILLCIKKTAFSKSDFLSIDILNDNIPGKFSGN